MEIWKRILLKELSCKEWMRLIRVYLSLLDFATMGLTTLVGADALPLRQLGVNPLIAIYISLT